jgi:hypothetical protein
VAEVLQLVYILGIDPIVVVLAEVNNKRCEVSQLRDDAPQHNILRARPKLQGPQTDELRQW